MQPIAGAFNSSNRQACGGSDFRRIVVLVYQQAEALVSLAEHRVFAFQVCYECRVGGGYFLVGVCFVSMIMVSKLFAAIRDSCFNSRFDIQLFDKVMNYSDF